MTSYTLSDLKHEFRLTNDGDKWGCGIKWLFCICDVIHFERDHLTVPAKWEFRPSPMGPANEDDYELESLRGTPDRTLLQFGELIVRYVQRCRSAGLDY